MRYKLFTAAIMIASMCLMETASAQDDEVLKVVVGGSFAKPKIMPKLEKFGIAQITVNYKLTTTERAMKREKGSGMKAGAKLTAYLETTDGELTPADFQEVTDYFYGYFQKKLKESGIDTVAWSAVAAADFYKNADDKIETNEEEKGNGQVWVTHNANKGNNMYGGKIAFAFGKIKKAAKFCDEIGAPAGFFHLTVDFADVVVDVDIKTKGGGLGFGYVPYNKTTTFKYTAASKPVMKVTPADRNTLLWNEKQQGESIIVNKDIEAKDAYHTAVLQDPSRIKNKAFAFAKAMDPVIIETTREQYKAAAKKALEGYANEFIAKAKELKKE